MFLIFFCILFFVYFWLRKRSNFKEYPLPPVLFGQLPLIGHAHFLLTDSINLYKLMIKMAEYCNRQGGVIHAKLVNRLYYIITDPEDLITVANTCLQKPYTYCFASNWLGQGLFTSSGETWQCHRKLLNPAFSLPVIHGFLEVFNSQAKVLIHDLEPHAGQAAFNCSSYLKNSTLAISCMTAFGNNDIKDKQFLPKYTKAVDEILHILNQRMQKLWLHNDTLYTWLGERDRENKLVEILRELSAEVIEAKKAVNSNAAIKNVPYKSFVDLMIDQLHKNNLTEQEVKEELDTFIAASYETSAHSLEIALMLLGSHPEVQEKMYKEIIEIVGDDKDVTKEDLQKLVYTEAVIKESLRYNPIAPVLLRRVDKEVKLKNYTLRSNSRCFFITYGMHRHPSWGPDAHQFKPERWLDPASAACSKAYAAFSYGKRSCIGKTFAILLSKVTLVHLLRTFKIAADYTKAKFKLDLTLHAVKGNEISLERR